LGLGSLLLNDSEIAISCDLEAEPDLRKIGRGGDVLKGAIRPFAFGESLLPSICNSF
jgi:hypothetical protein